MDIFEKLLAPFTGLYFASTTFPGVGDAGGDGGDAGDGGAGGDDGSGDSGTDEGGGERELKRLLKTWETEAKKR